MPIYSDVSLLNAKFGRSIVRLHKYLIDAHETGRTKTRFEIFETYRDPVRQASLLGKGTSKAGPFQSAHQFGLACDIVPHLDNREANELASRIGEAVFPGWSWHSSHDYSFLAKAAEEHGLTVPISWDRCHVEHPKWREFRKKYAFTFE